MTTIPGEGKADTDDPLQETWEALTPERLVRSPLAVPEKGMRGLLYKAVGINLGLSAIERRERDLEAAARTPVRGRPGTIAVASGKGGVGKTTVTALLASMMATLRGDRVLAIDGNPDSGTLGLRIRTETHRTVADMVRELDSIQRLAEFRTYTNLTPSRLEVLAAPLDPQEAEALDEEDYRKVLDLAARYYSVIFIDLGTGLMDSANRFFLEQVDQALVVASPAVDGGKIAAFTVEVLSERRGPNWTKENVVVVINGVRRDGLVDVELIERYFKPRVRSCHRVAWDRTLAAGGLWTWPALSRQVRNDILELSALVAPGFENRKGHR